MGEDKIQIWLQWGQGTEYCGREIRYKTQVVLKLQRLNKKDQFNILNVIYCN